MVEFEPESVLVIGAGPAGIACAKALSQAGVSYRVVDRATVIASTWHALYPSLKLNTTRFYSHFDGMRFPLRYGYFATARQYYEYLLAYTRRFRFNIHLGITVQRVSRHESGAWCVETSEGIAYYRAVICATGIYGNPTMPHIDGIDTFSGKLFHAQQFKHPHQVTQERVLVVGNGPSGVDIAVASAETAERVWIAIRNGITMTRRYPFGFPRQFWMLLGSFLPKAWCNRLMKGVTLAYGDTRSDGLPKPTGKTSLTAYQGRELLDAVRAKKVTPVSAPIRFEGEHVFLADGTQLTPSVVIMATGYEPVLQHYLDVPLSYNEQYWESPESCEFEIGGNGQRGFPLLDRSEHPNGREIMGQKGLYVVGVYYKGKGAIYNMQIEARIATQQIQAYLRASTTHL